METEINKEETNLCVSCGLDLGSANPRQYCRKTYCPDLLSDLVPDEDDISSNKKRKIEQLVDKVDDEIKKIKVVISNAEKIEKDIKIILKALKEE